VGGAVGDVVSILLFFGCWMLGVGGFGYDTLGCIYDFTVGHKGREGSNEALFLTNKS
jgi:hypothetical protein